MTPNKLSKAIAFTQNVQFEARIRKGYLIMLDHFSPTLLNLKTQQQQSSFIRKGHVMEEKERCEQSRPLLCAELTHPEGDIM